MEQFITPGGLCPEPSIDSFAIGNGTACIFLMRGTRILSAKDIKTNVNEKADRRSIK